MVTDPLCLLESFKKNKNEIRFGYDLREIGKEICFS